jgi:uncharacterized coiled-coil protein SlyX
VSALEGTGIEITSANFSGLARLCEEFGFEDLRAKLSEFPLPPGTGSEDAEARERIAALEEKAEQYGRAIEVLQSKLAQLSADIGRLTGGMRALSDAVSAQKTQITAEGLSTEFAELRGEVSALKAKVGAMAAAPPAGQMAALRGTAAQLSAEVAELRGWTAAAPESLILSGLHARRTDSLIVSDFPAIFAEFRGRAFKLLWRGSRDGFGASQFHGRCDGHANTLTVVLDAEGNIFGGFTPVEWESPPKPKYKADGSEKSFLFTLKNPHNIAPRRFALKPARKQKAILCDAKWGPYFGHDMRVSDNCHANTSSYTNLGIYYTNSIGLNGMTVFTGSCFFQVKEIEVFEITD